MSLLMAAGAAHDAFLGVHVAPGSAPGAAAGAFALDRQARGRLARELLPEWIDGASRAEAEPSPRPHLVLRPRGRPSVLDPARVPRITRAKPDVAAKGGVVQSEGHAVVLAAQPGGKGVH